MKTEHKEALETLDREIAACCVSGIFRTDAISLDIDTAQTLRALIDDLDSGDEALRLAEDAYKQADAKLKDALVELERLRTWKHEQLTVTAWWNEVDDAVRKHREIKLGDTVAKAALRLIQERDSAFAIALFQRGEVRELVELIDSGNGPKAHAQAQTMLETDFDALSKETLVSTALLREILDALHYVVPHLAVGGDCRPKIMSLVAALEKRIEPARTA